MADIIKDDFIKRSDALLSAFDLNIRDCSALLNNGIPYQHIKDALLAIKAIDVQPVVHGKWIEMRDPWGDDPYYNCSCCNDAFVLMEGTPKDNNYNFCPNCGARMDGGT